MRRINHKATAAFMSAILMSTALMGCGQKVESSAKSENVKVENEVYAVNDTSVANTINKNIPKYIFLFIGDGMSYPQVQSAAYYLGTMGNNGGVETEKLSFMNFPVNGSAQTFDSTSFCPDSASTATSISTGNKTYSGVINMDTSKTVAYETITEKLKEQLSYKIGVLTSVNLNHATPAAFYAHQASRSNYYEIGQELIASGFDYFAGGGLLTPTG